MAQIYPVTVFLSGSVGAAIGTMVAFVVTLTTTTEARFDATAFPFWLLHPIDFAWWPWALLSGLSAAALYVVGRLSRA